MYDKKPNFIQKLAPFLVLGVMLAIFVVALVFIFHIFLWGLILGFIFFALAWVKETFFTKSTTVKETSSGRIIEHEKD